MTQKDNTKTPSLLLQSISCINYTKKIHALKTKIRILQDLLDTPPFLILHGIQEVKSNFLQHDWREHVFYILARCNVNHNWILHIINETNNEKNPDCVKIQFISTYVKNNVHNLIENFVQLNQLKTMHIQII